jgi:hypothetical protein
LGAFFCSVGVIGLTIAAVSTHFRFLGVACALASFFLAASALSTAARIAGQLPLLVGKPVRVEVWGQPLHPDTTLHVDSVRVLGAGLHIYLKSPVDESPHDLKIAQPRSPKIDDTHLEIGEAAYISWAGIKLKRDPAGQRPALLVSWPAAACSQGATL